MLTQNHLKKICLVDGGSGQCRYLDEQVVGGKVVYLCQKLSPDRTVIDEEVQDYLAESRRSGKDPQSELVPLGDNCPGYLPLRTKAQGFDASP